MSAMVGGNGSTPWGERGRWALVVGLPVAAVVVAGWQRRWLGDDAFINLRVIRQIGAGHGPVFNTGERVEVATSPLWLAMVGAVHAVTRVRLEWVAVGLGLACTAAAMMVGATGARRLHRPTPTDDRDAAGADDGARWWLPVGLVAFAATPVVWDYATGGLENGLSWLWWAATFALAVRATVGTRPAGPRAAVVCAGLGPLVRPDLGVVAVAFVALVVLHELAAHDHEPTGSARHDDPLATGTEREVGAGRTNHPWEGGGTPSGGRRLRRALALVGWAALLPGAFQVFRMGYYGQLLPNTVYAKEGGRAWWSQGATYLGDLVGSYTLWAAALAVALVAVAAFRGGERIDGRMRLVSTAVVAATLHVALVVRAGGDYMHGRLLLPAVFGLLLPVAVVPVPRAAPARRWTAAACAGVAAWTIVVLGSLGPHDHPAGIQDERRTTVASSHDRHPVLVESHVAYLEDKGIDLQHWGEGSPSAWRPRFYAPPALSRASGDAPAITFGAMGAVPYRLPLDVYVADQLGLADAVTAHVRLEHRSMPGHEKYLGLAWWAPRLLPDDVVVPPGIDRAPILVVDPDPVPSDDPAEIARRRADATAALACGELRDLREASTAPLTMGRFARNLLDAPGLHSFRFDREPATARADLCR